MTIQQYYDELTRHDWYFNFSDDPFVYRNGRENEEKLKSLADSREKQNLFEKFQLHHFSGEAFGTIKIPKPERPV